MTTNVHAGGSFIFGLLVHTKAGLHSVCSSVIFGLVSQQFLSHCSLFTATDYLLSPYLHARSYVRQFSLYKEKIVVGYKECAL